MEHARFKANLTAATYVSHELEESAQEEFELHLMSCAECVEDVEAWRAIEKHMPRAAPAAVQRPFAHSALRHWRLAASLIGIGILSAAGGWYGRMLADSALDRTAFFNAAAPTRGAPQCTALKFPPDTERVAVRFPGVASDSKLVARDASGAELRARRQSDGSWLLQFAPATLARGAIRIESAGERGAAEPVGCLSAQPPP